MSVLFANWSSLLSGICLINFKLCSLQKCIQVLIKLSKTNFDLQSNCKPDMVVSQSKLNLLVSLELDSLWSRHHTDIDWVTMIWERFHARHLILWAREECLAERAHLSGINKHRNKLTNTSWTYPKKLFLIFFTFMVSNRLQPQIDTCMSAETVKWPVSLSWCILNVPYFGFLKKSNNSHFNNGVCPECTAHVPQPSLQSILQLLAVCLHLLLQWLPPTNPEMSQRTHRYQWCCWKSFQYPAIKVYFEVWYWQWKIINIAFLCLSMFK